MKEYIKKPYLYIMGALIGTANGMFGSGGGIIAVPMLEYDKTEIRKAHATSIGITLPLSLISGVIYFSKGSIDIILALKFIPFGILGTIVGAKLLTKLSAITLKRIFGAVMVFFGIRSLIK